MVLPFGASAPLGQSLRVDGLPSGSTGSATKRGYTTTSVTRSISIVRPAVAFVSDTHTGIAVFRTSHVPMRFVDFVLVPIGTPFGTTASLEHYGSSSTGANGKLY